jgi:glycosyltransferase involved in cell wall biosynthesis
MLNVTVAITTFNRLDYLEKMRASLYETKGLRNANIRVYDDCSTEYDERHLVSLFPDARTILRARRNRGCDENLRQAMLDFLSTKDDIFVVADSDLIFNPEWLTFLQRHFQETDGIMSLYNSCLHPPLEDVMVGETLFVRKDAIGAAGSAMNRAVVKAITKSLKASSHIDWKFSDILQAKGIRLLTSKRSYVQHIGVHGTFNLGFKTDFGLNFLAGSATNEAIMTAYTEELLLTISRAPENLVSKTDLNYRVGKLLLDPIRVLKHPRRSMRKILDHRT